ncbi:MAG TPA: hypothetical protein VH116_12515 [Gemmatimonadales bacterium]|nr:hypothetical protein [Gemmatimonadales bacterium]
MTLTRLVLAWLPVALEFALVDHVGGWFDRPAAGATPTDAPVTGGVVPALLWRSLEAAVVTLFASLWFDSLGHGAWWLVFLLVGLMVSLAQGAGASARAPGARGLPDERRALWWTIRETIRYVVAGGLLAWRLG